MVGKRIVAERWYEIDSRFFQTKILQIVGAYWKQHRKILTPAFHFEILKQFVQVFQSVGNVLIDNLRKYEESPSIDLHPLVTLCTLDTICGKFLLVQSMIMSNKLTFRKASSKLSSFDKTVSYVTIIE
jgi:cytochrome P450